MTGNKQIRVLMAKPGLDGHDRGAKLLARVFSEAGMKVFYTGLRQTPEMIAKAARDRSVNVLGISSLSGGHNYFFPRVIELLREQGTTDLLVIGGGIIPSEDIHRLKATGTAALFGPGSRTDDIVQFVKDNVSRSQEFFSCTAPHIPQTELMDDSLL